MKGPYAAPTLRRSCIPPWIRVDDEGNVWTSHNRGGYPMPTERRAETTNLHGYLLVRLAGAQVRAHRIVYAWFNGSAPKGQLVCHKNDVKTDNRPENLELGDNRHNQLAAFANGRQPDRPRGEANHRSTLTDDIVREIRRLYASGLKVSEIGRALGISYTCASTVVHGKTWGHVT